MPTTANSARTMIWRTAKSTEVSRPQMALPSRAAGPGTGRAAGRRAARVAIAQALAAGSPGRRAAPGRTRIARAEGAGRGRSWLTGRSYAGSPRGPVRGAAGGDATHANRRSRRMTRDAGAETRDGCDAGDGPYTRTRRRLSSMLHTRFRAVWPDAACSRSCSPTCPSPWPAPCCRRVGTLAPRPRAAPATWSCVAPR